MESLSPISVTSGRYNGRRQRALRMTCFYLIGTLVDLLIFSHNAQHGAA